MEVRAGLPLGLGFLVVDSEGSSRRVVRLTPPPLSDAALACAFAFTAGWLFRCEWEWMWCYLLVAVVLGLSFLPTNYRRVTLDFDARTIVADAPYGLGRSVEARVQDLTIDITEGTTRRKYGRMAPWLTLRVILNAGTPNEQTLFASSANDSLPRIALLRELGHALETASRDEPAAPRVALDGLVARTIEVGTFGYWLSRSALATVLAIGAFACLVSPTWM